MGYYDIILNGGKVKKTENKNKNNKKRINSISEKKIKN